ncbi:DUF3087 family protein [Halomonas halocynthiae]|uniref:DUF3087 family protein n=1 Tax=Halomonas halocynthiae TaxID=176290 RepID=UPI00041C0D95|nr:DUF3087 family protein [Halomonas halocynthiae]
MDFYFEDHAPERYRRLTRRVGWAMAAMLIVFSLAFTQLLNTWYSGGAWLNVLAVVLGVIVTSLVFTLLRHKAWMEPIRYGWRLKQRLSRVSGYLPALRRGLEARDPGALAVLGFYHQGMAQLSRLDGRALDDDAELLAERQRVRLARLELGFSERVDGLSDSDLSDIKRG